ncbi:hypothetical protein [Streptomyces sp. NPDC059071]|uniref:hypothetical protein n=1 Tax=unclassified Streptomyces TaxID=2593676 RepID=UPI0036577E5A
MNGWKYVNGEPRWRPDIETAMAEITSGLYGQEYEDRRQELDELVDAVRREWAAKLRTHEIPDVMGQNFYVPLGVTYAADLLDPDQEDPK